MADKIAKPDEEWRKPLTPEQYQVTRKKGTEPAFTGKYWNHHEDGTYTCVCCGNPLFQSDTKFESGSGWPSFFAPADPDSVATEADNTYGMRRGGGGCHKSGAQFGHGVLSRTEATGVWHTLKLAELGF